MNSWQIELEHRLSQDDAPAVLTRDLAERFANSSRQATQGKNVPISTLTAWLAEAVKRNRLSSIKRGLYLNGFRPAPGRAADAAPWLVRTESCQSTPSSAMPAC